jgi:hypothetical protein
MMPPDSESNKTNPRKPISRRLRFEILRRDNNTCRYCHATDSPLTIDHVVPVALGGTDDPSNLVAACKDCNAGKTSSSPDAAIVAQVSDDAVRWAAAMQAAADQFEADREAAQAVLQPWLDNWYLRSRMGFSFQLPKTADEVLRGFLASGMPMSMLIEAADVALDARSVDDRFRYFIGVARNMLAKLQKQAASILAASEAPKHAEAEVRYDKGYWTGYTDCMKTPEVAMGLYTALNLSRVVDGLNYNYVSA